jgi:MerR family transcriptional regulator/heat shock protein HspR
MSQNHKTPRRANVYHISIVAQMVETHPQTLRTYERMGLVNPQRTSNNIRLYTEEDVEVVRKIQHLTQDLGVNLAGVEVVFKLLREMERLRAEIEGKEESDGQERTEK